MFKNILKSDINNFSKYWFNLEILYYKHSIHIFFFFFVEKKPSCEFDKASSNDD